MRALPHLFLLTILLLPPSLSRAQQIAAASADSVAQPAATTSDATVPATADVILCTNGDELPGRVLSIGPEYIRYVPVRLGSSDSPTDTLRLATATVFLIRYGNGTKEVLRPVTPTPQSSLVGLSTQQRYDQGRQDSRQYYHPAKGVFWGTYGATLAGYGYGGVITGAVIGLTPPRRQNLQAPTPALLNDPAYYEGYRRQAQNRKLGKAAAGFGVGVATEVALVLVLVGIFLSAH